ncbi:hypothetical protein ACFLY2_02200 [Patescibacteria group bacterium]
MKKYSHNITIQNHAAIFFNSFSGIFSLNIIYWKNSIVIIIGNTSLTVFNNHINIVFSSNRLALFTA